MTRCVFRCVWIQFISRYEHTHPHRESNIVPVSADRQPVAEEFIGHVELVVLRVLPHTLKVLQLDAKDHVFGFGHQVDVVVAQPELTSAAGGGRDGRRLDKVVLGEEEVTISPREFIYLSVKGG